MPDEQVRAVFLDRDGTIIEDVGYATSVDQLSVFPYVPRALGELKAAGFRLVLISNQSGVARGFIDPEFPEIASRYLKEQVRWQGQSLLDAAYYCPHHPEGTVQGLNVKCECRKPEPGMLLRAARDLQIELPASYVIGDHLSDIEAAHRVGATGVLLMTGHGPGQASKVAEVPFERQPDHVANDLLDAAHWILEREGFQIQDLKFKFEEHRAGK